MEIFFAGDDTSLALDIAGRSPVLPLQVQSTDLLWIRTTVASLLV